MCSGRPKSPRRPWDEGTATWTVTARDRNGVTTTLSARAVISAVGQLNRPHLPEIPGQDGFTGPSFHSSEWDHSVDLRGKRVALIGAGASGFQIAPAIAGDVAQLTVFQRTAQWMFPNPNYHEAVGPGVQWALRHLPFYGRWYRFLLFWPFCDKGLDAARVDPDYPDQQRAVSEVNDIARMMFTEWITSQVGDDAELLANVVPDYPATGKRTLQDNGSWLAHAQARQRRARPNRHRPHRTRRGGHRRRRSARRRRHRVRDRVSGKPDAVADEHRRTRRRPAEPPMG